jgi:hypothetical protein
MFPSFAPATLSGWNVLNEAVELLEQMERGFGLCKKALFTAKKRLLSG